MVNIKREKVEELNLIISDLRMAMDIEEEVDRGMQRGLANFADGTKISVPIPGAVKGQLNSKIAQLFSLLKEKMAKLELKE